MLDDDGYANAQGVTEFDYIIRPWWANDSLVKVGALDHVLPAVADSYPLIVEWMAGQDVPDGVTVHPYEDDTAIIAEFTADPLGFVRRTGHVPGINYRVTERGLPRLGPALSNYLEENGHVDIEARRWQHRADRNTVYVERDGVAVPRTV